jgi:hypothetical protein
VAKHPDRDACARAIAEAQPPAASVPKQDAIAFWADVYNLVTILAIAEDPTRWGPQQDGKILFRDRRFAIAGRQMTLDELEHDKLMGPSTGNDPRVEFLLSCGSRSCALLPNRLLSAGTASRHDGENGLDAALREGMRRWFARPENLRVRRDRGTVEIGQLLQADWHGADFEKAGTPVVELVAHALEERKGTGDVEAAADLRRGALKLAIRPYDWRANRLQRLYVLP